MNREGIRFGCEECRNLEFAAAREWLVTNGIGGFASGTVAGGTTRRYHGLLIAALRPPVGRMQLVGGLDEIAKYAGREFALATHWWASGAIEPQGFLNIEGFYLDGTIPVWTYAVGDALLEKRVWMRQGENTTFVRYTLLKAGSPVDLQVKALVNYRDFNGNTHAGDWRMSVRSIGNGVEVMAFEGAAPFYVRSVEADCEPEHIWYRDCLMPRERERALDDREDQLFAAIFGVKLKVEQSATIVATTQSAADMDSGRALGEHATHEREVLAAWDSGKQTFGLNAETKDPPPETQGQRPRNPKVKTEDARSKIDGGSPAPEWLRQLVLAANQFIVKRALPEEPDGRSVIAGYHWFGDWGRDTMIALPGLALATRRPEIAKRILLAFARYVDGGMLPNNFPDAGGAPEYNTVDAALWYFEAARQYYEATRDTETVWQLFPVLASMVDAHAAGTRYKIHVDPADGLLYAGVPGVQLTWMDAKVGDWVVTPRIGKPVEINALWLNALETMSRFARLLGKSAETYQALWSSARKSFGKFWNAQRNCCYDVIDAPGIGNDESLRPNQIFAASLPVSPLTAQQQKAVVDVCTEQLLTPYGLRSLAPGERGYQGQYGGDQWQRDGAYHQGTVWGWLLGPFVMAHFRVYRDAEQARRFLDPLGSAINLYGLGTLAEIFDGDAPFTPRGCIAQAWTVAEVLRAWSMLRRA